MDLSKFYVQHEKRGGKHNSLQNYERYTIPNMKLLILAALGMVLHMIIHNIMKNNALSVSTGRIEQ